jgi:transcriptional regulator with XRE-family HTH domain
MARDSRAAQALRDKLTQVSQNELSRLTGISQGHLSRLASGERVAQDRAQAMALHEHAGIELAWWDEAPTEPAQGAA